MNLNPLKTQKSSSIKTIQTTQAERTNARDPPIPTLNLNQSNLFSFLFIIFRCSFGVETFYRRCLKTLLRGKQVENANMEQRQFGRVFEDLFFPQVLHLSVRHIRKYFVLWGKFELIKIISEKIFWAKRLQK